MSNTIKRKPYYSRRRFLLTALAAPVFGAGFHPFRLRYGQVEMAFVPAATAAPQEFKTLSPSGKVQFVLHLRAQARLNYELFFMNKPVMEPSPIGILIDSIDLGQGAEVTGTETYQIREVYPCRGIHSQASNNCHGVKISLKHRESNTDYVIEVRVFNDGIAFRYIVPGFDKPRVPDESTGFVLPEGSTVWYHDFEGHYEGVHTKKGIAEVKGDEWAAVPLTVKLPNKSGYAAITEAALINYSGMGLEADGRRGFRVRLGHALPVSYPFRLRYKDDIERLAKPASIAGTIVSPWRVVMIAADLNTLVNCDIIQDVSPPPDKKLFPAAFKTEWIKPGRAVWKYLDGGENTLEGMKEFSRLAGELGFEYNLVEGFWQRWTEAQMRELVEYSRGYKVGIWFWKHSRDLRTPEARRTFFSLCKSLGVVGAKIDFFDHEAKEIIDLYQSLLREAAEFKIMVDFHGANKPAGESRTWPNEMAREAIRGLEASKMTERAQHNATLPFTRMLAGHADYTVMHFGERRRETSWAHQIASAAIISAPLLVYAAHPKNILENPAAEMIKSIPPVWDETMALPACEIGEVAVFARRKGETWFLAIMNGPTARNLKLPLSFLGPGKYASMVVSDRIEDAAAVKIENKTAHKSDSLLIEMRAGGGFIARFFRA